MKDLYWRGGCCPLQIIYRMEYNKTKAKGYTLPYDTPHQLHMKKVKEITSNVSPGLICRRSTICCWLLFLTVCFPVSYSWSTKRFTRRAKLRSTWTQTLIRSVPPRRLIGTSPTWASSLELIWILIYLKMNKKGSHFHIGDSVYVHQLDYKKKYEATKAKWNWTTDRPDFLNAAKNSMQQSDVSFFTSLSSLTLTYYFYTTRWKKTLL